MTFYNQDEDGNPVGCDSVKEFSKSFEMDAHVIASDQVGDAVVSTVFLGLDLNFSGKGKPVLWETMVFGGEMDQEQWRYDSVLAAMEGHGKMLELVMQSTGEERNDRSED